MKLTFTLIALCSYCLLNAQKAGTLDSSFGVDGEVITNYPNDYAVAYGAAILKDNTLILTGEAHPDTYNDTAGILLLNYLPDGTLNPNFGNDGKIILNLSPYSFASGRAISILSDGRILIAGPGVKNQFNPNDGDLIMIRFNPDGTMDSTFGKNGLASKDFGAPPMIRALQVQPDGKILIGGAMSSDFFLTRYNANGTIDKSFGNGGYVLTSFLQGVSTMSCIAVEPNGEIMTAGTTQFEGAFAQYMPDGSPDVTFATTFNAASSNINSIAMENDGSFVVAGDAGPLFFGGGVLVAKFKSIGVIDQSFGTKGRTIYNFGSASSVYLQADSKIVIAGTGSITDTGAFMVSRLQENGIIDSSFGINGIAFANFFDYAPSNFKGFPDNNGKIVLAGNATADQYRSKTILLARFNNNDETKKQIIIKKIKHYIQTHNDAQATTLNKAFIYPNPAQNILQVEGLSSAQKTKLTVVDFAGNIKLQAVANASSYNLNIASLHAGNYLLKIETNGEVVTKEFVKE